MCRTQKLAVFLCAMFALLPSLAFAGGTGIDCFATVKQDKDSYHLDLNIGYGLNGEIEVEHPENRNALTFIIMDERGNIVMPNPIAKVDPRARKLKIKNGNNHYKMTFKAAEAFSYISGTGMYAYNLDVNKIYRLVVVYRWDGMKYEGYTCGNEWILDKKYHGVAE